MTQIVEARQFSLIIVVAFILLPNIIQADYCPNVCQKGELYFEKTGKCYLQGQKQEGPCGRGQHLVAQITDQRLGDCRCISQECLGHRPLAYVPDYDGCYYLYDEGPCEPGKWLVPWGKYVGACKSIPCLRQYSAQARPPKAPGMSEKFELTAYDPRRFLFEFSGKCYQTLGNFPRCGRGESVYFDNYYWEPKCTKESLPCGVPDIPVSGPVRCADGSHRDKYGGCNPLVKFSA